MPKRKSGRKRPNPENFDDGLTRVADDFKPIPKNHDKRIFMFGYNQCRNDVKDMIKDIFYTKKGIVVLSVPRLVKFEQQLQSMKMEIGEIFFLDIDKHRSKVHGKGQTKLTIRK